MDISVIKADKVTIDGGIVLGAESAPITTVEFLNLACPYCRKWFYRSDQLLTQAVKAGRVRRIIKLLNKDKDDLQLGNLAHTYLPFDQPETAVNAIRFLYTHQPTWRPDLAPNELDLYLKQNLKLTPQNNQAALAAIEHEAQTANIQFVPTIILGQHIFDESIDLSELEQLISQ